MKAVVTLRRIVTVEGLPSTVSAPARAAMAARAALASPEEPSGLEVRHGPMEAASVYLGEDAGLTVPYDGDGNPVPPGPCSARPAPDAPLPFMVTMRTSAGETPLALCADGAVAEIIARLFNEGPPRA